MSGEAVMVEARNTGAIKIPWYSEADYKNLLSLFMDGDQQPSCWQEWRDGVECLERTLYAGGIAVQRVSIRPARLAKWCWSNGMEIDAEARHLYINAFG